MFLLENNNLKLLIHSIFFYIYKKEKENATMNRDVQKLNGLTPQNKM